MIDKEIFPKNWKIKKMGDVCKLKNGFAFKSTDYVKTGVPVIRISDINNGLVLTEKAIRVNPENEYENYLVELNDILIAMSGATTGKFGIFKTTEKAYQNQRVGSFKILNNKVLDNKYLFYQLNSLKRQIEKDAYGGAQPNISSSKIEEMGIVLPPFSEQQQIVSKIEELFSELDKGKQQLETVRLQLKTYRQAVLKWAFEGRFTNKGFKDGELPEGWKWVKSGEIIETINNGYTPKSEFLTQNEGEIPFIKVYNLNFNGTLNFLKTPTFIPRAIHEKELKRSICYPDDVLINIVGPPLGKVSVVSKQYTEWNINQAVVCFRPNKKILSKFISYFLQNPTTINWLEDTSKATAGQWNVKVSTCRLIPIPLPPITDQQRIINEIETRLSVCDKIEETITNCLQQSESLRQSILKQAFEGKLVKPDENYN
jgi:Restriction endonuclease S subunits